MSASDQQDPKRQAHPGAASEHSVRISKQVQKVTDVFELTEDGKVILKDAELFEAIRQAEDLGSGEKGFSPDKTRRC